MSWLERLAHELSENRQQVITVTVLRTQIAHFIANCEDTYLRDSYPKDIHHLDLAAKPQAKTVDLILSFMNETYGQFSPPIIREMASRLAGTPRPRDHELDKVLRKERKRRWVNPRSTNETDISYWSRNHRRVRQKYAGLYALIRRASDSSTRVEPFAIVPRADDPTTVSAFWKCREKFRLGDLLVNTYRFSGITVTRSTDKVMEPATISFLRTPRTLSEKRPEHLKPPVVMGGFIVGWKDNEPHRLYQSRFALIKLSAPKIKFDTDEAFWAAKDENVVTDQLHHLEQHPSVTGTLVETFLKSNSPEMGHLDAKNALPGLFPE
jgi:hypothetical protein